MKCNVLYRPVHLGDRIIMPVRSREVGTSALGGLVVGGVLGAILGITDLPFATTLGALIGGLVAAYLLYGKVGQAATAGGLSGMLSYPFSLGIFLILFTFGLYTPPSGPTPPASVVQAGVAMEFMLNLASGVVGAVVLSSVRRPSPEVGAPTPLASSYAPGETRFCVQCGARLQAGTLICPHCNVRQPQ